MSHYLHIFTKMDSIFYSQWQLCDSNIVDCDYRPVPILQENHHYHRILYQYEGPICVSKSEYMVKDITLAEKGRISYEWARANMKLLDGTITRMREAGTLKGKTIGFCLHITKETSVLLMGAKELGASVAACPGNPLSTQDDIAAFLASEGIHVYAWRDQTDQEYFECIDSVLGHRPDVLVDDGGDMNIRAHTDARFANLNVLGATEETTAGVTRIQALEKAGKMRYPIILVNNALTKLMFDNRYGAGQSTIDGLLRAANLLLASKVIIILGYGWIGRGVARACRGMGARVVVTEVNHIKALEAHMDGYEVMPAVEAAPIGDMFITTTGMTDVVRKEHILQMKDGAILGNVGHFDVEIDTKFLLEESESVREVRPNLDECVLQDGRRIYLIGKGRLANLVAAEGHPPEVMAQSFANQILSIQYILENHAQLESKIMKVPDAIDYQIARDALSAMQVEIDDLNEKQKSYAQSW